MGEQRRVETDVLIIGAGVAGLSAAIKLAMHKPDLDITIITVSYTHLTLPTILLV